MSSTVFIICCLQSVTLSWLVDYGRLQFSQHFVLRRIYLKTRSCFTASLATTDSHDVLFYFLLHACVYVCMSNDFTAAWLTITFPQPFAVAATLKSIDYNVAMTFILNNNNNNNLGDCFNPAFCSQNTIDLTKPYSSW